MSRLRNHPCVPILLVQQPEEGLCVCCLPLFAVRWVYRKVTTPFSSHVSWPVPQYSQQAGRGGGSASKASAVRSGSLSAAVALLHRQNSERQQSQGRKETSWQASWIPYVAAGVPEGHSCSRLPKDLWVTDLLY